MDGATLDRICRQLTDSGLAPERHASIAKRGYWRLGGPADVLVNVPNKDALMVIMGTDAPVTVLGNGSNLLVADEGIRGITVRLVGDFRSSEPQHDTWVVGAGVLNTVLLKRLGDAQRGGLGCLAGVPGTVGGAIRMNAGTSLGEIGNRVVQVEAVLPGGSTAMLTPQDIQFRYRRADLPDGAIVTRVWLKVMTDPEAVEEEAHAIRAHLLRRKNTQPLDQPSCGSVFMNPPGDHAGRLIEAAGLKGKTIGGACISPKHANFIVNQGDATATDVYALVKLARDVVFEQFQTVLIPEVHAIGDWPDGHWPLPPL